MVIQISEKSAHLAQKFYFYQNTTNKESWKLEILTQVTCFMFLLKFIEILRSDKKRQIIGFWRRLGRVRIKNLNHGQNTWKKMK